MSAEKPTAPPMHQALVEFWDGEAERYGEYTRSYLKRNVWVGDRLSEFFPGANNLHIADIGTGAGFLAVSYAQLGHTVTATEISERMLEEARRNAGDLAPRIDFVIDDAEETNLPPESFDLVILRDVFCNLVNPLKALDGLINLVRPGGYLIISDGNYFLHRHDDRYRLRHTSHTAETGRGEYEAMLDMSHERAMELESIVGDLEVNRRVRPYRDAEFAVSKGMNNIRIRCDDRRDYIQLNEHGKVRVPLRYTFSFQKPYVNSVSPHTDGTTPRSYTFQNKVESASSLSTVFSALANEDRVRILLELDHGPLSVSELSSRLSLPVKNTSYHLNLMKAAGILDVMKDGRESLYFQKDESAVESITHVASSLYTHR